MKILLSVIALFIVMTGQPPSGKISSPPQTPPPVLETLRAVRALIADFNFEQALQRLSTLDSYLSRHSSTPAAASIHLYRAVCHQRLFQFPEAIPEYILARDSAQAARAGLLASTASHNLSNLHLQAFSLQPALAASEQALQSFPDDGPFDTRLQMEIHYARLLARTGDPGRSIERLRSLFAPAALTDNRSLEAWVWEALGREELRRGNPELAEEALSQAFRIRSLSGDPETATTLLLLGELRLDSGNPVAALHLFDAAARSRALGASIPEWRIQSLRALALLKLGRHAESLRLYRQAIHALEDSRVGLLPADSWRVDASAGVSGVFDGYVDALLASPKHLDLSEVARATLGRRAASLRADPAWTNRARLTLPPSYWTALNRLQSLQARAYRSPSRDIDREIAAIRASLSETEASAGAASILGPVPAVPIRLASLAGDQAVLVFHAARDSAFVLAGTPRGWRLLRLPSGDALSAPIRRFAGAVESGSQNAVDLGADLYRMIFGLLSPETLRRKRWLVLLDNDLFVAPFAALVTSRTGSRVRFLVESHSVILASGRAESNNYTDFKSMKSFLGLGDPVYNTADPRAKMTERTHSGAVQLARLPGSAREVKACAALFPERSVLTGSNATLENLSAALARSPDIVHIASHALPAPDSPRETLLALSLGARGGPELVSPEWIAARNVSARLVVMTGCRSGSGEVRRGEGLMGLTRAWLYAGAGTVLATYWPTLDDSGELVTEFYRQWRNSAVSIPPEEALRRAQVAMLSRGGWRAEPRYWGAYFISSAGN